MLSEICATENGKKILLIDSRNFGEQSEAAAKKYVFFAISGERHKGADTLKNYIGKEYEIL